MQVHENFINGEWAKASAQAPNINPSNLADVVGEFARADEVQARAAIAAARAAFPAWSRGPIQARADMLDKIGAEILARKDELGTLLAREEGKTKAEAIGEATRAGYLFR
ncbi:MAG: aldehyde dehydrogenase family protein, partial [Burkholderiales bacterium]